MKNKTKPSRRIPELSPTQGQESGEIIFDFEGFRKETTNHSEGKSTDRKFPSSVDI